MNNSFGIGIPTFNRWDLLEESIKRYVIDFPNIDIHIYDNGEQNIPENLGKNVYIHKCGKNIGVAGAWNYLIEKIFEKSEYALILNDDIYFGKQEAHIRLLVEQQKFDFAVTPLDWCAFVLPKTTWDKIGKFDENFYPAYCEDCDYHLRMKKKGMNLFKTPFLIPKTYRASMTMEKNPELFYKSNYNSLQYFKKKWGKYPEELL